MSNADIPIDDLTVAQKLSLMERIWVDLEKRPSDIPSPDWHGDVLARRLQAIQNGELEFSNWSVLIKSPPTSLRMNLRILPNAERDLELAADFYESQARGLGGYFLTSLISDIESLRLNAGIHEQIFEFHRSISKRFPFAIYYRVGKQTVDIYAILDCRSNPRTTNDRLRDENAG